LFKKCGFIRFATLKNNKDGKPSGTAFVGFKTQEAVQLALKLDGNKEKFSGRTLSVQRAKEREKTEATDKEKTEPKDKQKKEATKNNSAKDAKKQKNGKADDKENIVKVSDIAESDAVVTQKLLKSLLQANKDNNYGALEGIGAKIVRRAQAIRDQKAQRKAKDSTKKANAEVNTVFIQGLPSKDFGEEAFRARFADCGAIKRLWMPLSKDGTPKGMGTITFKSEEAFKKALAYNGTKCKGSVLTVKKGKSREDRGKAAKEGKVDEDAKAVKEGDAQEGGKAKRKADPVAEETPAKKSKKVAVEEPVEAPSKADKKHKEVKEESTEAEQAKKKSKKAK
jgi:RNA recognition motif-containing protein